MMSYEADAAVQRIEDGIAQAQQRAVKAREFRAEVDRTLGAAEVDGVSVHVDVTGVVRDLRLPRPLQHRDPDKLATSILAAIRAGHAQAAEQAKVAAEAAFGDSDTTRMFAQELDSRLAQALPSSDGGESGR